MPLTSSKKVNFSKTSNWTFVDVRFYTLYLLCLFCIRLLNKILWQLSIKCCQLLKNTFRIIIHLCQPFVTLTSYFVLLINTYFKKESCVSSNVSTFLIFLCGFMAKHIAIAPNAITKWQWPNIQQNDLIK